MIRQSSRCVPWAYLDDRSLRAPTEADLQEGLRITEAFDCALFLQENRAKRQWWGPAAADVEHLGLTVRSDFARLPTPRDTWQVMTAPLSFEAVARWH